MIELTKDTFELEVSDAEGYVLVDYYSPSCEPCSALLPKITELSEKYCEKVKFTKLNTASARRLAISQRVMGLPTIILYKNGEKVDEKIKNDATIENVEKMILKQIG